MPEQSTRINIEPNPDTSKPTTDLAQELADTKASLEIYKAAILQQREQLEADKEAIELRDQLIEAINQMYASVPKILGFKSLEELYSAGGGALAKRVTKILPSLITGAKLKGGDEVGEYLRRSQELFTEIYGENALLLNPSNSSTQIKKIS